LGGHGGQLRADRRNMAERCADDRDGDHERCQENHSIPWHGKAGHEAQYDKYQRNIHCAEGNKPGDDREDNVESAGKPADFIQHRTPPFSFRSAIFRRRVSER
jgi:hypothetical protein